MISGMLSRPWYALQVQQSLLDNPVTAILGPRQCGKTTLARMIASHQEGATHLDLENPIDRGRLAAPMVELGRMAGLVILDEIQRMPECFEILRVLADRPELPARFLVLGSAAPELMKGVSESLAGRVGFVDLGGFRLDEVGVDSWRMLWVRGGFPRSYLAESKKQSVQWRDGFIRTFLERDLPAIGVSVATESMRRFWSMVAHYHGQIWNAAELARSLGIGETATRRYLDLLCGAYMVRQLQPWHENLKKRQVKAPKVYLRDSGLLHSLLRIEDESELMSHPKCGASWEGFVVEQIIHLLQTRDAYYWATHSGAELDLLVFHGGKRFGFEVKLTDAPVMTRSIGIAMQDLGLHRVFVVYPGQHRYELSTGVEAIPVTLLPDIGSLCLQP